jgi:hypothetical protein
MMIVYIIGHRYQSLIYPEKDPKCTFCENGEERLLKFDELQKLINRIKFLWILDYTDPK